LFLKPKESRNRADRVSHMCYMRLAMKTWKSLKKELLRNKKVAEEYKKLAPRYQLISQLIESRLKKGLTQEQLAKKIGTRQSAIARLESGRANPSVSFLERMATATGSELIIQIK